VYLRNLDLADLMERARRAVVGQATSILRDDPAADLQYVVLDMPCSFFSLRSLRFGLQMRSCVDAANFGVWDLLCQVHTVQDDLLMPFKSSPLQQLARGDRGG
jgi:hypothetical protein